MRAKKPKQRAAKPKKYAPKLKLPLSFEAAVSGLSAVRFEKAKK